jgi:hypothetical protein
LATSDTLPTYDPGAFNFYAYKDEIRWDVAYQLGLPYYPGIQPFDRLPAEVNTLLGHAADTDLYNDYWNSEASGGDEWFCGTLQRIDCPFGSDRSMLPTSRSDIAQQ